jgi:hypothetical protein
MSVLFNQTNINETTTFAGNSSVFLNGVQIGPTLEIGEGVIGALSTGYISDLSGNNQGWLASQLIAGDIATSYLKLTSTTLGYVDFNNLSSVNAITLTDDTTGFALTNISTINGAKIGASPQPYISSVVFQGAPSLNSTERAGVSTILQGLPTGSTVNAQIQIDSVSPAGSNVSGVLYFGMAMSTVGLDFQNYLPYYFNTATPGPTAVFQMNGLINIPNSTDQFVVTCSNASSDSVIADFTVSKVTFVS